MKLTDTEWTVMQALWDLAPTATARDVHDAVHGATGWSYSTVRTLLARLAEKGAVEVERRGTQSLYRAGVTRESARRSALRSLLDRAFGGRVGTLVQHLAEEQRLSPRDRAELERLLDEDGGRGRGARRSRREERR